MQPMAIAFARVHIHSRSHGQSAVAGSAYRSGSKLLDQRTGETHDYSSRLDVVYTEILLPKDAHEKFLDRQTLWNAVEAAEKRKDAQVAKDIILALPKELTRSHQIALAQRFAQEYFVSKGIPVDLAIHDHGDGNPHAHLYLTTRRLVGGGFDRYKARDLNPVFASGRDGRGFIAEQDYWGRQWGEFQNRYFQEQGLELTVDPDLLMASRHEGRIRSKENHYLKDENQLKREALADMLLTDTDQLLALVEQRYAVFSEQELAKSVFLALQAEERFQDAWLQFWQHPDVIALGIGEDGRLRYTTRNNFLKETQLVEQALALQAQKGHTVDRAKVAAMGQRFKLNAEQTLALEHLTTSSDISAVIGYAGTGKSYLLKAAHQVWQESGYTVLGGSTSGIAAKGMQNASGISSTTLASFRVLLENGYIKLTDKHVFVLDESGMTDLHEMAYLVSTLQAAGAKLVLVGDPSQLQPVGAGAPFRAILERTGWVAMQSIVRQQDEGDRQASQALAKGDIETAMAHYAQKDALHFGPNREETQQALIQQWLEGLGEKPSDRLPHQLILAHQNQQVDELNQQARVALIEAGIISKNQQKITVTRLEATLGGLHTRAAAEELWLAPGDRILFRKNHHKLGIANGDFATVVKLQGDQLTVRRDDASLLTVDLKAYKEISYGYAATLHKAQGATLDKTYVYVDGHGWDRHLLYVALTRHREQTAVYFNSESYQRREFGLGLKIWEDFKRERIPDNVLDWPVNFAERRGFEAEPLIQRLMHKLGVVKETVKDGWAWLRQVAEERKQDKTTTKELHPLKDASLEWQAVSQLSHPSAHWIGEFYAASQQADDKKTLDSLYQSILNHAKKLGQDPLIVEKLTEVAPKLAQHFATHLTAHSPKLSMDWLAAYYQADWAKLEKSTQPQMKMLVEFYQLLRDKKHSPTVKARLENSLMQLAGKMVKDRPLFNQLRQQAPQLAAAFSSWAKQQAEKSRGRDR